MIAKKKMECSSVQAQKLEAMKNYYKKAQFLYNLVVYSLTALLSCLFYLYLFWFPSTSFASHCLSVLVPNIYSFFLSSPNKMLFILGNLIVLYLVGESKLAAVAAGGSQYYKSPADEIYDEYVRRNRSLREIKSAALCGTTSTCGSSIHNEREKMDGKVEELHNNSEHKKKTSVKMDILDKRDSSDAACSNTTNAEQKKVEKIVKLRDVTDYNNDEDDQGDIGRDALNRRVEDFIARVRQRMLEERQIVDQIHRL